MTIKLRHFLILGKPFMLLTMIGVKNVNVKWFKSYLSNRKQFVMVNNVHCDLLTEFNVSVPQGLILGPLLSIICINDMYKSNLLSNSLFCFRLYRIS